MVRMEIRAGWLESRNAIYIVVSFFLSCCTRYMLDHIKRSVKLLLRVMQEKTKLFRNCVYQNERNNLRYLLYLLLLLLLYSQTQYIRKVFL